MDIDWQSLLVIPTPEIVRMQRIADEDGAGILWSNDVGESRELSALGVLAWEGREGRPSGPRYEWVGFNLLCNAAPAPFVLNGENFYSIDSFHEALKIPEGTPERATCAMSPMHEAQRTAQSQGVSRDRRRSGDRRRSIATWRLLRRDRAAQHDDRRRSRRRAAHC